MKKAILNYIHLLRLHHYVKNGFIFLPLFFAGEITRIDLVLKTSLAFIAFSLIASAVYIFNDLCDLREDRRHPAKMSRPLVQETIAKSRACLIMAVLVLAGLALSYFVLPVNAVGWILLYLGMNLLYSLKLKQIAILDITIIAVGFVIRLLIGAVVGGIPLTVWIIVMTFLLALFIGLGKRRSDILIRESNGDKKPIRKSLQGYNLEFINSGMVIVAGAVIVAYIMYAISPATVAKFGTDKIYFSTIFVILGILRYLQISFVDQNSGSPIGILFNDRFLQLSILLWLLFFVVVLYLRG